MLNLHTKNNISQSSHEKWSSNNNLNLHKDERIVATNLCIERFITNILRSISNFPPKQLVQNYSRSSIHGISWNKYHEAWAWQWMWKRHWKLFPYLNKEALSEIERDFASSQARHFHEQEKGNKNFGSE